MLAFDTLKAMKLLKESGFEEAQAEAVVTTVRDAVGESVATKADIAELRADLKEEMVNLRMGIYRFIVTISLAVIGVTVSLIKLLP